MRDKVPHMRVIRTVRCASFFKRHRRWHSSDSPNDVDVIDILDGGAGGAKFNSPPKTRMQAIGVISRSYCFQTDWPLGAIYGVAWVLGRRLAAPHGRHRPPATTPSDAGRVVEPQTVAPLRSVHARLLRWTISAHRGRCPIPQLLRSVTIANQPALTHQPQPIGQRGTVARF